MRKAIYDILHKSNKQKSKVDKNTEKVKYTFSISDCYDAKYVNINSVIVRGQGSTKGRTVDA